jgi:hypothetical protein
MRSETFGHALWLGQETGHNMRRASLQRAAGFIPVGSAARFVPHAILQCAVKLDAKDAIAMSFAQRRSIVLNMLPRG